MKIRIFGGIASGKSTLATYLGTQLRLPVFCTDDFVYMPNFGKRRSEEERIELLHKRLKTSWIVKGVHFAPWVEYTYKHADIIIIIDKPKLLLAKRVVKRTFNEEKSHYTSKCFSSMKLLWMLFRDTSKEIKEYKRLAKKHKKKIIMVHNDEYTTLLNTLKK